MISEWKDRYKKSKLWEEHGYLVNADDGTKVCAICEKTKYTTEFPNADEFDDRKVPTCTKCFKKTANVWYEKKHYSGVVRTCKKCKQVLSISNFAYRKNGNKLSDTCRDCVGTYER